MGRPNDLFGPETMDSAPTPRAEPRRGTPKFGDATPAPVCAAVDPSTPQKVGDDGLITVSGMDNVALIFLAMSGIREHHADMVQRRLITVADRSHGKLAVSLSEVAALNSSGINALVAVHTHCASLGGHLALFALSPEVRKVFKVTKLDRKMILADNVHEAVQSFTKPKKSFLRGAFTWARQDRDAA
jgi:anti-anti-sigma factor